MNGKHNMYKILTINPGSTAVKYLLFSDSGEELEYEEFSRKEEGTIQSAEREWLSGLSDIKNIGIRIVHGGDVHGPILLTSEVERQVDKFTKFAPIHNTIALDVVKYIRLIFNDVPIVASFDTDFHKTMPVKASTYPINIKVAEKHNIKRYGFHGIAVQSVLAQLFTNLEAQLPSKIICVHLGGGCSVTAIKDGESVDTTMGLTPLEGLMMITRSGSVDPSLVEYIADRDGWTPSQIIEMLNNNSGFYGLTGSKNTLDIISRASKHQEPEKLAVDIFVNQIVKQIFAYYGTLQGCDSLVFSGGIGYGNAYLRSQVLRRLKIIGITEENTYAIKANEAMVLFENTRSSA